MPTSTAISERTSHVHTRVRSRAAYGRCSRNLASCRSAWMVGGGSWKKRHCPRRRRFGWVLSSISSESANDGRLSGPFTYPVCSERPGTGGHSGTGSVSVRYGLFIPCVAHVNRILPATVLSGERSFHMDETPGSAQPTLRAWPYRPGCWDTAWSGSVRIVTRHGPHIPGCCTLLT